MRVLEGKVAVLTGSAGRIGRTTARSLAEAGASVVLCDLITPDEDRVAGALRADGGQAVYQRADVSSPEDMEGLATLAVEKFGRLDIWINNAALNIRGRVTELSPDDWDRVLAVCLKSVYLGAKYAIPLMKRTGGGSIINISSVHARAGASSTPAYDAAKTGMIGLTRQIALDYGPEHIRANSILPGLVRDEPVLTRFGRNRLNRYVKYYPVGRYGRTPDVAGAIIFLASDAAEFITGASLVIDGGTTTYLPETLNL